MSLPSLPQHYPHALVIDYRHVHSIQSTTIGGGSW